MESEEDETIIKDPTDENLCSEWLVVDPSPTSQDESNTNPLSLSSIDVATAMAMEPPALKDVAASFHVTPTLISTSSTPASATNEIKKLKKEYVVISKKPKMSKTERRAKQEAQRAAKGLNPDGSKKWDRRNNSSRKEARTYPNGEGGRGLSSSSSTSESTSYLMGAIIGDIAGSRFESHPHKDPYDFDLIAPRCRFTDDTVLTIAVADALIHGRPYDETIRHWAKKYPRAGYGKAFRKWMHDETMGPYNSWGNGSAMRVSPCGYLPTLERVLEEAKASAECTHNHEEGVKGAQATAACIFLAREGKSKVDIKNYIADTFDYNLDRTIEEIRPTYRFDSSCWGSVPEAIIAFLDGKDYRDTIRLAISLGGDSDTQAAIAGSIAQAYYGNIPHRLAKNAREKLEDDMIEILDEFNAYIKEGETC